ncbi:BZ3500_MvSof-1268-A1-R1_Chr4-2g07211 [Microbotryum saponariae]|uniref:BZ3500_MvSof-1268-A1-R1_Chr4-2g07211 protein n=1 Tax=Microbotryum saponariae TaxID=289078 RepID=A0A2X0NL63_9BASI|nr:BZ3500_MvSof-1268-A1-R1_Chr4-2g07211 [Microbotryum saponariae]SDA06876.1 BZ3501_MvSof-1269-A2-R1_Chr4-2g06922 [Microbotryum saponariae]
MIYRVTVPPHKGHVPDSSEYLLRARLLAPAQLWLESEVTSKGESFMEHATRKKKKKQLSEEEPKTMSRLCITNINIRRHINSLDADSLTSSFVSTTPRLSERTSRRGKTPPLSRQATSGLNPTDWGMVSICDSPDFICHMFPCKHMWLAGTWIFALASRLLSHLKMISSIVSTSDTAELEDCIQLYQRLADGSGRVHARLLRTWQELEAGEWQCDPLTRLPDARDGRASLGQASQ